MLPDLSSNGLLLPSPFTFLTCCSPGLIRANEPELLLCNYSSRYLGGQSANYFHLILLQAMCSPLPLLLARLSCGGGGGGGGIPSSATVHSYIRTLYVQGPAIYSVTKTVLMRTNLYGAKYVSATLAGSLHRNFSTGF